MGGTFNLINKMEKDNMPKIYGIYNNKGGVGKTTISLNLAGVFAEMGFRVPYWFSFEYTHNALSNVRMSTLLFLATFLQKST
jgi:Mrp family chromosome partitioning ATPase